MFFIKKHFIYYLLILVWSVTITSCKEEPTAPSEEIPTNLFPLEVGRQWLFDVKETDLTDKLLPGRTGTSLWKIVALVNLSGKQAYQMFDTVIIADTTRYSEFNFFHVDSKGNLWQYMLFESNEPTSGPGWLKMFNRELGFNKLHIVLDTTFRIDNNDIRFKITTMIKNKVNVSVPHGQFNEAYPGEVEITLSIGPSSISYKFTMWLVPGVGFVKIKEPISPDFGQPQTGWRIRELRNINF